MNLQELQIMIGDWLGKDEDSLPLATRTLLINISIREYLRTLDLRFGEMITPVTAVALQPYSLLPAYFSRPYSIWYLAGGSKTDVDFIVKEEFDIKYPDSSITGGIKHYTIWGNKIYWGPTPAVGRDVTFNYYGYLADLSAPADHNDFTDLAWEVLVFKSLGLASMYGIEDSRMPTWAGIAQEQERKLIVEHTRKTAGRRPAAREYGYTGK